VVETTKDDVVAGTAVELEFTDDTFGKPSVVVVVAL
jgi:hypothetical protein